jgi:hypothetical protein
MNPRFIVDAISQKKNFSTQNKMAGLKRHKGRALLMPLAATCLLLLILPKGNEEVDGGGGGLLRASTMEERAAAAAAQRADQARQREVERMSGRQKRENASD